VLIRRSKRPPGEYARGGAWTVERRNGKSAVEVALAVQSVTESLPHIYALGELVWLLACGPAFS
jgi:hypothetical protein